MKAVARLVILTFVGCTSLQAAETEMSLLLEAPPVYVLDAPYDSRVDSLPRIGDHVRPTIADLGIGSRVVRLTSPTMVAELRRLEQRFGQITEALYEQRFYGYADEYELRRVLRGPHQLTRDAEKLIRDFARANCYFDTLHGDLVADAKRTTEIIKALEQTDVPEGAGRKMLADLTQDLRDIEQGPYRLTRIREELLDACIAALKSSRMPSIRVSDGLVQLVQVDPYRQQYLEISSESLSRGPMPGLRATNVVLQRLSAFEPKVIQEFIDYWEMSRALGVFTRQDRTFFPKPTPFAESGPAEILSEVKAAKKAADKVRAFWKSQDELHFIAATMARGYFDSYPPIRRTAQWWDVPRCRDMGESGCFGAVERTQADWDREYEENKLKNERAIAEELLKKAPNSLQIIVMHYARMINELKYKTGPLPAESTGELYLADFLEFIHSTQLVRFDRSNTSMFEEDEASVPASSIASVRRSHDVLYRPLQIYKVEVPIDLDRREFPDNLRANPFSNAFFAQETAEAAAITSAMSRYRPPSFHRVVDEIRAVRAVRTQLDQEQASLASAFRREREQLQIAQAQMAEQFADGEVLPPMAGTIVGLHVANGALVQAGTPLLSLSPLLQYSAQWCEAKVGATALQSGLLLDVRLTGFELHADVAKVIKGNEVAWNSQIAPALRGLRMRMVVEEARTNGCRDARPGWEFSLQPRTRYPLIYLRVANANRAAVTQLLDLLGWRYFIDGDELTAAVDGPFIDATHNVRVVVDNG